jgi:hypothetical protein
MDHLCTTSSPMLNISLGSAVKLHLRILQNLKLNLNLVQPESSKMICCCRSKSLVTLHDLLQTQHNLRMLKNLSKAKQQDVKLNLQHTQTTISAVTISVAASANEQNLICCSMPAGMLLQVQRKEAICMLYWELCASPLAGLCMPPAFIVFSQYMCM